MSLLSFFTTPPGHWLYAIILLVTLEAPAALAFNQWWALRRVPAGAPGIALQRGAQGRLALAAGVLFFLNVLGLAATLLIPAGSIDARVVLPPLERAIIVLTALLLSWALAYPNPDRQVDLSVGLLGAAVLIGLFVSWPVWGRAVAARAEFYNGTTNETLWLIAGALLLAGGVWRLYRQRLPGWQAGLALLGVLLAAHAVQYLFPVAGLDAPPAIRWAQVLVLPPAMWVLYRRAQAWPIARERLPLLAEPAATAPARPKPALRQAAETILITALLYLAIEFASGRFRVDGPSMQPTLYAGQFVLTDKLAYRLGRPQRGDIVVVHPDTGNFAGSGLDLVKRVIGLPGETVTVASGRVYIDNQAYPEMYIAEAPEYTGSWRMGPDEYFVMGDNRNNSSDSHLWGPLPRGKVTSRVLLIYWPPSAWVWVANSPLAAAGN